MGGKPGSFVFLAYMLRAAKSGRFLLFFCMHGATEFIFVTCMVRAYEGMQAHLHGARKLDNI